METDTKESSSWLDTAAAKTVGAGVAVAAMLVTARDAISRGFFKSMNKGEKGLFYDLQKKRDDAIGDITAPTRLGIPVPDAMEKVREINREYDMEYAKRRKMINIHTVVDEAKALKKHQWLEVLFTTAGVGSVAVGALLTFNNSRKAIKKHEELEKKVDEESKAASR